MDYVIRKSGSEMSISYKKTMHGMVKIESSVVRTVDDRR